MRFVSDEIEALVSLGRVDEAEPVLAWLDERGRALDRASALGAAARCRGLLAAAAGDLESALAAFEQALVQHQRIINPFETARTLLALGSTQRRAKMKSAARETLGHAEAGLRAAQGSDLVGKSEVGAGPDQRPRAFPGRVDADRASSRRARGARKDEQGGRVDPLRQRSNGGIPPLAHLSQARCPLARRAGPHLLRLARQSLGTSPFRDTGHVRTLGMTSETRREFLDECLPYAPHSGRHWRRRGCGCTRAGGSGGLRVPHRASRPDARRRCASALGVRPEHQGGGDADLCARDLRPERRYPEGVLHGHEENSSSRTAKCEGDSGLLE